MSKICTGNPSASVTPVTKSFSLRFKPKVNSKILHNEKIRNLHISDTQPFLVYRCGSEKYHTKDIKFFYTKYYNCIRKLW